MERLILLKEKRDGSINARACANRSTKKKYISRKQAASPTVSMEALLEISVIDVHKKQQVMTLVS